MRACDFDRAWAIADRNLARVRRVNLPKHEGPRHQQLIWRGERLSGKRVLVRCYHGLGDTIQFVRFVRPLRMIAREVIVWCQPELVPLISAAAGVDRAIALHDGTPDVPFDVDIEIMEIPHAIKATRHQFETRSPYLRCLRSPVPRATQHAGKLSIGLVWRAGDWDSRRSFPVSELERLHAPGTQLWSLQRGEAAKAADEIGAIDVSTPDIMTLAGRLRALDVVICPDTMVAHLAAALGCRTWILLPAGCDWRWPERKSRTVWYPTARLFHQDPDCGWSGVFEEVRRAIRLRLRSST